MAGGGRGRAAVPALQIIETLVAQGQLWRRPTPGCTTNSASGGGGTRRGGE